MCGPERHEGNGAQHAYFAEQREAAERLESNPEAAHPEAATQRYSPF